MKNCSGDEVSKLQMAIVTVVTMALFVVIGWVVFIIGLLVQTIEGNANVHYFKAIGIGIDEVVGTMLFGTVDHTVSANIGVRAIHKKTGWSTVAKVVDFFFGEDHCVCIAKQEGLLYV